MQFIIVGDNNDENWTVWLNESIFTWNYFSVTFIINSCCVEISSNDEYVIQLGWTSGVPIFLVQVNSCCDWISLVYQSKSDVLNLVKHRAARFQKSRIQLSETISTYNIKQSHFRCSSFVILYTHTHTPTQIWIISVIFPTVLPDSKQTQTKYGLCQYGCQ